MAKGYTSKRTLMVKEAQNVCELIEILKELVQSVTQDGDIVYVENSCGEELHVSLIEETLTDDSIAYNVRID